MKLCKSIFCECCADYVDAGYLVLVEPHNKRNGNLNINYLSNIIQHYILYVDCFTVFY